MIDIRTKLLEAMDTFRGKRNAAPRRIVLERLRITGFPDLSDGYLRDIYATEAIACCPSGIFIPETHEEVEECYEWLFRLYGPFTAAERRRVIYARLPDLRYAENEPKLEERPEVERMAEASA